MHAFEDTLLDMPDLRRYLEYRGVVQGVGFRPHIARLAGDLGLSGACGNTNSGAYADVQGEPAAIAHFIQRMRENPPPAARIVRTIETALPPLPGRAGFAIDASRADSGPRTLAPPDMALCAACAAELADPADRRAGHPFITCVDCGPRYSIIVELPYDRPNTTMAAFPMCPACAAEYADPADRRHHAQPICCPDCGPRLRLVDPAGDPVAGDPLAGARAVLAGGGILAVKGIGGMHLLCDAADEAAVAELRRRKRRPDKPLAVMAPDPAALVELDAEAAALLASPAAPIVIGRRRAGAPLAAGIAPGLDEVGVLARYAPVHALLVDRPMVATSGNPPGAPLCHRDDDAIARLSGVADALLLHDRPIHQPVEDSVYRGAVPVRRARGLAPLPAPLPAPVRAAAGEGPGPAVLAVGGELKNAPALAEGPWVHLAPHLGDVGTLEGRDRLAATVDNLLRLRGATPAAVVCDAHPGYASAAWAEERFGRVLRVQHHHAHALALLGEHDLVSGVVAALDGTGYGADGAIWGGEILDVDGLDCTRAWHVPAFAFAGGDRSVTRPWRSALCLARSWGLPDPPLPEGPEPAVLLRQLDRGAGVASTSLGRIFDAAAVYAGAFGLGAVTHEGQAAMALEAAAARERPAESAAGDLPELFAELIDGGGPRRFHDGLARILAERLAAAAGDPARPVGVTGGCALNRLLVAGLAERLPGLRTHRLVPPNDGGLALGQAIYGVLALAGGSAGAGEPG